MVSAMLVRRETPRKFLFFLLAEVRKEVFRCALNWLDMGEYLFSLSVWEALAYNFGLFLELFYSNGLL